MKIIGKTGSDSYLVDMTESELLNLIGFHAHGMHLAQEKHPDAIKKHGGGGWDRATYSFRLGLEFEVSPIFKWANEVAAQHGRLLNASKILTDVSETIMRESPRVIVPAAAKIEDEANG